MSLKSFLWPCLAFAAVAAAHPNPFEGNRALYFLDNNPAGASVVALKVSARDGKLSDPSRTSTGGHGMYGLGNGVPPTQDTTFSQGIIFTSGSLLFTVNPGSSTVSLFRIPPNDPWHPVLIGKPAPVHGSFPNSITYSPRHNLACAVATGSDAGVTCFNVDERHGLTVKDAKIPLPEIHETNPPSGPGGTASDIIFNPSQTALFVSVKSGDNNPGYIHAFPVINGAVTARGEVVSRPKQLTVDFGLSFLSDSRAVISDPSIGAALLDISWDFRVTVGTIISVPNNKASCWTAYSQKYNSIFIMDGGNPNITVADPSTGKVRYQLDGVATARGAFDTTIGDQYLYSLEGAAGIAVFDLNGKRSYGIEKPNLVQNFDLSFLGSRQGYQGLAFYPSY